MMAVVAPFSLSADYSHMHDLRHLKISSRNVNRMSADASRLSRTLSPRDLNIPNSLRNNKFLPRSEKLSRHKQISSSNPVLSPELNNRPVYEISLSKQKESSTVPQFTSLPISITTDTSSISDSYHSAQSDFNDSLKSPEPRRRRLRSSEVSKSPESVHKKLRLLEENAMHSTESVPKQPAQSRKKVKTRTGGISAKFVYHQPVFNHSLSQPLFEKKSESFIDNRIFALENAEEFNKASCRQSSIEVPSWRLIELPELQSRLVDLQRHQKAKKPIVGFDQKEETTDAAYNLRHGKHEQQEIKRERRCVQLQLESDRRAHLEEKDRNSWKRRRNNSKLFADLVAGPGSRGRLEVTAVHLNPSSLGGNLTHVSEEQALRNTPRQLTLSPCKVKRFRVSEHIPVTAFGALVPVQPQKHFSLSELRRFAHVEPI